MAPVTATPSTDANSAQRLLAAAEPTGIALLNAKTGGTRPAAMTSDGRCAQPDTTGYYNA